jgi:hypothetical protein
MRRLAPKSVSAGVLVCVVLTSGAMFGMAAQAALQHFGLDFGSIHSDLIADRVAKSRSAVAWWGWWLAALMAFFVGPLSVALTRTLVANWWLLRGLRLLASAAFVLGLAAVGQLRPGPTTLGFTATAAAGLLVVTVSTLLAALGTHVLGGFPRNGVPARNLKPIRGRRPISTFSPLRAALPLRGGGSASSGVPFLGFRRPHALAPGSLSIGRLAVAAVLAVVVFAAVSVLGGTTVLLGSIAPSELRELVASKTPPAGAANRARTMVLALLPADEERPRVLVAAAVIPVAPVILVVPEPVEPPALRQRVISAAVRSSGTALSESDLTFTKGYSRRRAVQLAANMTSLPSIPQLTAAINIKKIRTASLRLTPDRRVPRSAAEYRHRTAKDARRHDRYADYNPHHIRHGRHERRRFRDRYGDNRFARAEPPYRRF